MEDKERGAGEFAVQFSWDAEAGVWTAESADVPGLALEDASFDALTARVRAAIPELVELNRLKKRDAVRFLMDCRERLFA
jgi:hypothetical protein